MFISNSTHPGRGRATRWFLFTWLVALLPAATASACPYDLLAMCCTQVKNGKCTRWQNCCSVLAANSSSDHASQSEEPNFCPGSFVADGQCAKRCDGTESNPGEHSTCLARCAREAPATESGNVLFAPGFKVPGSVLSLAQLSGFDATVPMQHTSAGIDLTTHGLAIKSGNLDVPFRLRFECPAGQTVAELGVQVSPFQYVEIVNGNGPQVYDQTVILEPFQPDDFEAACQDALGGTWASGNGHPDVAAVETTWINTTIEAFGRCSGWVNEIKRSAPVQTRARCIDRNAPIPPEG